jgi:prepilin-type N-terminal cleavage/methylation domain-containing protein
VNRVNRPKHSGLDRNTALPLTRGPGAHGPFEPRFTEAGFTLIELMVVVMIISIVCVLAVPSMSREGYDRRSYTDAANVAELVREARTRAVARGAAELLIMTASPTGNSGNFQLWEANVSVPVGGVEPAVSSTCNAPTVWPTAFYPGVNSTATATYIDGFQFAPGGTSAPTLEGQGNINMRINDPFSGGAVSGVNMYLCFTPAGRTWYAEAATPPASFTGLAPSGGPTGGGGALASICTPGGTCVGAVTIDVTAGVLPAAFTPSATNIVRTIWIPPSGATRITSQ